MSNTEPSEQIISVPESFDDDFDDEKDKSIAIESVNTSKMIDEINNSKPILIESMDDSVDFNANDNFAQNLKKTRDSAIFRNQTQYVKKEDLDEMDNQTNVKGINLDDVASIHSYQPGANFAQEKS